MEKKMEKMKKEIKTQNRFYLIIAALLLIAQCTNTSGVLPLPTQIRTLQNLCMGLYLVWLSSWKFL